MRRRSTDIVSFGVSLAVWGFAACGGSSSDPADASVSADAATSGQDARTPQDGTAPLAWVDFSLTGCESGGADMGDLDAGVTDPCTGTAPLSLDFAAVSPAPIEVYLWTFGDEEESGDATPEHVYTSPGNYGVTLIVQGPGGTATVSKPGVIVVQRAGLGAPCTFDLQCAVGYECICDGETSCPAGLSGGICSVECSSESPCSVGICANLAPSDIAEPADWQRSLCLPACSDDPAECNHDLHCRDLQGGDGTLWVQACFPVGLLGELGEPCTDPEGAFDDGMCASGACMNEGARGVCSEHCEADGCSDSAACATFTGGDSESWCLLRCTVPEDCTHDPWLACEAAGGDGDKGFTVDEPTAVSGYCAPKTCIEPDECGDSGTCTDGFCGPST